jgi:ethanolamine utilization protein EutN
MIVGKVLGNVWATRKEQSLNGLKLMIVKRFDPCSGKDLETIVAADFIGAGAGETVLVTTGSSARLAGRLTDSSVDAVIVGIIDELDVKKV